jgi:histidinol-phosphate/aromatic aminotransferase/cobyric acid decarboxylase-like protein
MSVPLAQDFMRCDALGVDERHASQRFLDEPAWARGQRPERRPGSGLDLSDVSGLVPATDIVRRAARNVSPLSMTRPSAWMLRDAIAKAQGLEVGQIFPRSTIDRVLAPIIRTFVGPGDHVGLASPCRPAFVRQVLAQGARYVDVGRGSDWAMQHDALERVLSDRGLHAVILGRPDVPTGTLTPLSAFHQALHAGLLVIADETQLAYADPSAGLPRTISPRADSALTLFRDADLPTQGLIVLRSIPGVGPGEMLYAVGEVETMARVWSVDAVATLSAPLAAAAWLALDHTAVARRTIVQRCAVRSELRTAIHAIEGFEAFASGAPCLMVRRPGTEGGQLRDALAKAGLGVAHSSHPSWRDAVALGVPLPDSLPRVVTAFEEVAEGMSSLAPGRASFADAEAPEEAI